MDLERIFQLIQAPNVIPYVCLQLVGISVKALTSLNDSACCLLPI